MGGFSTVDGTAPHAALTTTHGGTLQTAAMKNVASGIAGLKANGRMSREPSVVAAVTTRHTYNTEMQTGEQAYTKIKTITLNHTLSGSVRVRFELAASTALKSVYGKIYKNGIAIGTEFDSIAIAYDYKNQDFVDVVWMLGDTIELWGYAYEAGQFSKNRDFILAFDDVADSVFGENS